jgi:iron complex outermembrane receptor protein
VLPSGRARITLQLSPGLDLAGAVGHTARVAEGNERFFALRRMGTDWVGNPALDPTRNTGVDLSVTLRRPRLTVTANGFANALNNYIAVYSAARQSMVPGIMNTRARSYANVDARQWGLEASGAASLRAPLSISGDISYVRATMTRRPELGITSTSLAETPPLRARLRARLDDGRLFAELEGVGSAAQSRVDRSLGEAETPAWAIANLSTGWRTRRFTATVGVANLFDTYFVEHLSYQRDPYRSGVRVAEPGRSLYTNVSWFF